MKTDQFLLIAFVLLAIWLIIMISTRHKEGVDDTLSSSTPMMDSSSSSMSTGSTELVADTSASGGIITTGTGGSYAPAEHNHDDKYAKIEHDHDSKYARADHTHDDLTGRIKQLEEDQSGLSDRLDAIGGKVSEADVKISEGERQVKNAVYNIQSVV